MKLVKLSLTVPQAMALWMLAGEGWTGKELQEMAYEQPPPVDYRAMVAMEDAIEKSHGYLVCRITTRTEVK